MFRAASAEGSPRAWAVPHQMRTLASAHSVEAIRNAALAARHRYGLLRLASDFALSRAGAQALNDACCNTFALRTYLAVEYKVRMYTADRAQWLCNQCFAPVSKTCI